MARRRRKEDFHVTESFEQIKADYRAGKDSRFQSRLKGVSPLGSGADYHYRIEQQYLHMIERARHYQRNDPIIGQAVRRLTSNIVQNGFMLDPKTGDPGLDTEFKARWEDWSADADQCHSEQELTFHEIEKLALSHAIVDGDVFFLPLDDGSLQPIEAHRVRTPNNTTRDVVHGVHLDERARRVEYWITKEDLDPHSALAKVSDIEKYPARDADGNRAVLHLYENSRFSQRRGVTAMAPISDIIGMHDDTQFAALVKQQMGALIVLFHKLGEDSEHPPGDLQLGPQTTETDNGFTRTIEGMSAGLEVFGRPGEDLEGFSPQIPGPGFLEHSMLLLTFIAINLDMPVHVLLLDPSKTNFSGWRGAIEQARLRYREIQRWLKDNLHEPVYRWKVRQWLDEDPIAQMAAEQSGINAFGHDFVMPTWPYLEPLSDASADLMMQRNGLDSPRRIQAARGRNWPVIVQEIVEDNTLAITTAIEASLAINEKYADRLGGQPVSWQQLISLPTPDGVSINVTTDGYQKVTEGEQQTEQGAEA